MELIYLAPPKMVDSADDKIRDDPEYPPKPPSPSPARRATLILRAESEVERQQWIDGLQARIRWQAACAAHGGGYNSPSPQERAPPGAIIVADPSALPAASVPSPVATGSSSSGPCSPADVRTAPSPCAPQAALSAIESATLAARSAAARAESAAVAADVCFAMSATQTRNLSSGPSPVASPSKGGARHGGRERGGVASVHRRQYEHAPHAPQPDIEAFLLQRQQDVYAELEANGEKLCDVGRIPAKQIHLHARPGLRATCNYGLSQASALVGINGVAAADASLGDTAATRRSAVRNATFSSAPLHEPTRTWPDGCASDGERGRLPASSVTPGVGASPAHSDVQLETDEIELGYQPTPRDTSSILSATVSGGAMGAASPRPRPPASPGGILESRITAEQMQMQMLIAMGATPIASGAAGAARHASTMASFAPLEAAAAVNPAWT